MADTPERPLALTVEQAVGCLASAHHDAPYTEACRLAAGANIRRDESALLFWRTVAEHLWPTSRNTAKGDR